MATKIIIPILIVCLVGALIALARFSGVRGPPRSEAEIAFAYACGYRNGQIAIMSRLPSLFTHPDDRAGNEFKCPDIQAIARKHGFAN